MLPRSGVVKYPDPFLRRVCRPVMVFDDDLREQVGKMLDVLEEHHALGLAACQIGWDARVLVMQGTPDVMVNPHWDSPNTDLVGEEEWCLSLPGVKSIVDRHPLIRVVWEDMSRGLHSGWFRGLESRVIQHEVDHLNGVLITDKGKVFGKR